MLSLLMALCFVSGCAANDADTFVEIGYEGSSASPASHDGDSDIIVIEAFGTPEPIVTPKPIVLTPTPSPTPTPTPAPSKAPEQTPEPEEDEKEEEAEKEKEKEKEKDEDEEREEKTPKPTATPEPTEPPEEKSSTPYANNYSRVSVDYSSSGKKASFESVTLSGESISSSIFGRADITMVNIWTRT